MEAFVRVTKLAQGGHSGAGCAMLVKRASHPDPLVLKRRKCAKLKEANAALREAKVLQRLQHKSIVKYHDVFLSEKGHYLIICTLMEYCAGGDLAAFMQARRDGNKNISERTILAWSAEVLAGLDHLHAANIVHRDMKPTNVFLTSPEGGRLKIGGFGSAAAVGHDIACKAELSVYLSPEVMQHEAYGTGVDVWGAGCIMLEMATLSFLSERSGLLSAQVLTRPVTPMDIPGHRSQALKALISTMLDKDPAKRTGAAEAAARCLHMQHGCAVADWLAAGQTECASRAGGAAVSPQDSRRKNSLNVDVNNSGLAPLGRLTRGIEEMVAGISQLQAADDVGRSVCDDDAHEADAHPLGREAAKFFSNLRKRIRKTTESEAVPVFVAY